MKLLLIGCEYAGTTTLAMAIFDWAARELGADFGMLHDHYKLPHTSGHPPTDHLTELNHEEQERVLALGPKLQEMVQRHSIYYHVRAALFEESHQEGGGYFPDYLAVGLHIEDAIYGRLYFDYGQEGRPGDRSIVGPDVERTIVRHAPDMVLVHVKAQPHVIAQRMREAPHTRGVLRESDIERVLGEFEEAYESSLVRNKLEIDTSNATVNESVAEFARKVEPYLTAVDRRRRDSLN